MSLKNWFKNTFDIPFTVTNINKVLLEAAAVYYNDDKKVISDKDFDSLKEFYERKTNTIFPVGAPAVGATLTLDHSYTEFAGTLSKCKNIKDLKTWIKNKKITNNELLVSIKADGHSIIIEFVADSGKLKIDKVLTRGADGKGKDLTDIFKKNLKQIPFPDVTYDCAVAYEAIVTYENFELLRATKTKREYKNPRSVINAIFSTNGQAMFKYISLLPIKLKAKSASDVVSRLDELRIIKAMPNSELLQFSRSDIANVVAIYERHEASRILPSSSPISFMYDGLVVESFNEEIRSSLGYSSTEPNFATALKFTPAEQRTVVKSIDWSVEGHTARYTPVVQFEPVEIRGNTYKQVSLANFKRFADLNLHVGDEIIFTLRNDTLGYVDKLATSVNNSKKPILLEAPTNCISCGSTLHNDQVFLSCNNTDCDLNLIGDLFAFIEKSGVKNIGLEMVKKLYYSNLIHTPDDLLFLDHKQIAKVDGFAAVSAKNIVEEVTKITNSMKDFMLLGSLNILNVGRTRSKSILEVVDFHELINFVKDSDKANFTKSLINIPGVGNEIINVLYTGIETKLEVISVFIDNINIEITKTTRDASFVQLTFCHTGSPDPIANRASLKEAIENAGHKLVGSVSKNTDYLINNDITSTTSKNAKARELNVNIIDVPQLLTLIA